MATSKASKRPAKRGTSKPPVQRTKPGPAPPRADPTKSAPKPGEHNLVLSMDGGSIYGTFTAIMLRKLCERAPHFMADDQVALFSGTSAGAINALLLAKENNPRDAIQNRKLEKFFADERVYSNRLSPIAGALSFLALTAWSGKADFYSILDDHFGDMKMKDLKHRVMITAFDIVGAPKSVYGRPQWRPKIFYNFPDHEPDRDLLVKDVAYGAASPPALRPIVNGITDGGFFASDPSAFAIAKLLANPASKVQVDDAVKKAQRQGIRLNARDRDEIANDIPKEILKDICILSVGVGAMVPSYFLADFDFGLLPFHLLPTNAMERFFGSPLLTFALNPAKDTTVYEAKELVGPNDYFRLDPPVIGFPLPSVINSAFLAKFFIWRQAILNRIYQLADTKAVEDQIDEAYQWLEGRGWTY